MNRKVLWSLSKKMSAWNHIDVIAQANEWFWKTFRGHDYYIALSYRFTSWFGLFKWYSLLKLVGSKTFFFHTLILTVSVNSLLQQRIEIIVHKVVLNKLPLKQFFTVVTILLLYILLILNKTFYYFYLK